MARLFSAIVPPNDAVAELAARVAELSIAYPRLRWAAEGRWHITLGFYGDDDPTNREKWLRRRSEGLPAPRLRVAGGGTFQGVLWAGVRPDGEQDARAMARLAEAAGAGRERAGAEYRPHLTVARWNGGRERAADHDAELAAAALGEYVGAWFTPSDVVLVRSDLGHNGPSYTPLASVALTTA